jgi:hypothetical protein
MGVTPATATSVAPPGDVGACRAIAGRSGVRDVDDLEAGGGIGGSRRSSRPPLRQWQHPACQRLDYVNEYP